MWPLPLVAMLGVSGAGIFAYSTGVFMQVVTTEFGWSRAFFSSTLFIQTTLGLVTFPIVGWLIDRIGPRRVALMGIAPFVAGVACLGLANGTVWQWWMLCLIQAVFLAFISPPVWIAAVVSRFHASRGLALAVGLAGLGMGALVWPILAAFFIERLGWRASYPALALVWGALILPLTALFVFAARDRGTAPPAKAKPGVYRDAIRSRTFVGLLAAGGLFYAAYYGMLVHFVPLLRANGFDLKTAATLGGLIGLFGIVGRLCTGYLLDRLPTRPIGVVIFLTPILTCALLLWGGGSLAASAAAAIILGLSIGAEMDIVTYIAARRFGQEVFGSVYALFTAALALCASVGPILGGALFDAFGSYDSFLMAIVPMVVTAALLIAWVPITPPEMPEGDSSDAPASV